MGVGTDARVVFTRRHSYATRSNKIRKFLTPGALRGAVCVGGGACSAPLARLLDCGALDVLPPPSSARRHREDPVPHEGRKGPPLRRLQEGVAGGALLDEGGGGCCSRAPLLRPAPPQRLTRSSRADPTPAALRVQAAEEEPAHSVAPVWRLALRHVHAHARAARLHRRGGKGGKEGV